MKRAIVIALALVLIAGSFATAQAAKPKIAVCLPGSVEFFAVEKKGMEQAAEKYGVSLVYSDAEWDAGKQLSQVEDFIANNVSAIMLCAGDNKALLPAVKACAEAKIPLITFTNVLGDDPQGKLDGVVSWVGISDVGYGHMLGQMAAKLLKKKGNIVTIEGNPGSGPQRQRAQGFADELKATPNLKVVYSQAITGWTKEGALKVMEDFIQTKKPFDLVSCHWSDAAVAAAQAIKEAGLKGKYVTCIEFSKALVPYIKSGEVAMTTNAGVAEMGFKAVETTAKYLKGEKVPAFVEVKPRFVDKANVDKEVPEL
jgi:ribose transport system substrate-binding protein